MNNKTLIDNLRCIPDFPKKGINFRDVTTPARYSYQRIIL